MEVKKRSISSFPYTPRCKESSPQHPRDLLPRKHHLLPTFRCISTRRTWTCWKDETFFGGQDPSSKFGLYKWQHGCLTSAQNIVNNQLTTMANISWNSSFVPFLLLLLLSLAILHQRHFYGFQSFLSSLSNGHEPFFLSPFTSNSPPGHEDLQAPLNDTAKVSKTVSRRARLLSLYYRSVSLLHRI